MNIDIHLNSPLKAKLSHEIFDFIGGGMFSGNTGGRGFGHFQTGMIRESREITLKNARRKIEALAQQLSLRRDRIDMAFHFFKLALNKHLTRGRKSTHVIAACVYITCRTESTPHMLIDFSDILQIDVYELGRTYLRLSQALCINIPAMDPCLYVMRFAHRLELGDKTHEVSMTALRLVSRMKKDWIHFGRRPSGLCGAALLIAARMHGYNRSVYDVIKVVKVHESTLRKRLNEFGETPTSQLTLEEFNNIDLDAMTEEQDPPSFKAARKRDRERLLRLEQESDIDKEIDDLESKIEDALDDMRQKMHKKGRLAKHFKDMATTRKEERLQQKMMADEESVQAEEFITADTLETIDAIVNDRSNEIDAMLMPPPGITKKQVNSTPAGLGLRDSIQDYLVAAEKPPSQEETSKAPKEKENDEDGELDLTDIDDAEIDGYIMTDKEIEFKTKMWMRVNAEYLKEQEEKAERERKEQEEAEKEGREIKKKPKKTKKKQTKSEQHAGHQTAIEAIEKIVAEKKISTKINYDVLRSLSSGPSSTPASPAPNVISSQEPASPAGSESGIFGSSAMNPNPSPNSVFSSSLNTPVKRLSSFRKERDLTLKRPNQSPLSPVKSIKASPFSPPGKRVRLSSNNSDISSNPGTPATPEKPVIIESGPVSVEPVSEADDYEDDDHEPEDELLSAKELLSRHTGEVYDDDEEDYYNY